MLTSESKRRQRLFTMRSASMRKNISSLFRRQVDVELHVLLFGLSRQTRAAGSLVITVDLFGVDVGFVLDDLLVEDVEEPLELGSRLRMPKVVIDTALSQLAPGPVSLLDDLLFDLQDLFEDGSLFFPVMGADRSRFL